MSDDGGWPTIVVHHDAKAFYERLAAVACCHALVEVVGQNEMSVHNPYTTTCGTADKTDAPVEVCRVMVAEVVGLLSRQVSADIERLVAYAHTVPEGVGRERFRWCETASAQEVAVGINHVCIAIKDGRMPMFALHPLRLPCNSRNGVGAVQAVSGIEEDDVVACSILQRLVHSIVESAVGFADETYVVASLILFDIALYEGKRMIGGAAVDDEMLYSGVVLRCDTPERTAKGCFRIVGDCCYGEERLHGLFRIILSLLRYNVISL